MTQGMSHEDAFAALDAVALDATDALERAAVLAHVQGCDVCRAELESLRAAMAAIAYSAAENGAGRDRVRSRLMARAAADRGAADDSQPVAVESDRRNRSTSTVRAFQPVQQTGEYVPAGGRSDRTRMLNMLAWRRAEWVALAASIMLVVSIGLLASVMKERENVQDALKEQIALSQHAVVASDSMRVALASRDSMIAGLTGRDVAVMSLTASGANAPFARMFWDRASNTWTLVAHNMPTLKAGRTYQLWLVTATAKISAGTFDSRKGDAVIRATYALDPSQLRGLAVTEEAAGGSPQPTSPPIIAVTAH